MTVGARSEAQDKERKARGAYFTPAPVAEFITEWAVRSSGDLVIDPSCGDAAFLVPAVMRLRALGALDPVVHGVEIHGASAADAGIRVTQADGRAQIRVADFFDLDDGRRYDAVVGNPPYVRYQGFTGPARSRARRAALRAGVSLSSLASSWAAFVVHAASVLKPGGRLGMVLPAELLSVNYAAPVRRFLFEHFGSVELVLFERQVFDDAETDTVLLLADQCGRSTTSAAIRRVHRSSDLVDLPEPVTRTPVSPEAKWTDLLVSPDVMGILARLKKSGAFAGLGYWGRIRLGAVTGNNKYFALSAARAAELGLATDDLMAISPPGSGHLRGLEFTCEQFAGLRESGRSVLLFRPQDPLDRAARKYVSAGCEAGINEAYKCRVRTPWYRVPVLETPDLFLTCMNADTPRLTTNEAGVRHLNSVHGVYLFPDIQESGRTYLPIASLNSVTLLDAELSGRSYGGGILKIEPREAVRWLVPSETLVSDAAHGLDSVREEVVEALGNGRLLDAVALVDSVLLGAGDAMTPVDLRMIRSAAADMAQRRITRRSGDGR
ncbi:HsdM family class I SAM-dependent methyltransferase [Acidipropionibacterium virtanenii]|uniref:Modification methylase Eco57IB n=1 Tax=Acidipropionibacterium virtanenii TaxID=2057246 RepID=A0A344UW43_9ACTN|nr:N-6 DNA methylase [Acidipropionibacterium virtanenii]AXE39491.1 Modification methylase Eco57IB [Acidipropionibacterium virtanenii]